MTSFLAQVNGMSEQSLKIAVVTPCFNSVNTIRDTLESVARQDYGNREHFVIDGGSSDGTLDILRRFREVSWSSEKDKGHYDAMNKGVVRSTGDVIIVLNADDCFRPGALSAVAHALTAHPDWDACFADVVFVTGSGQEIYRRREALYDFNVLRYWDNYICHQTLFVRRSVYDRLGGYRSQDFLNVCDYEFLLRMGKARCVIGHVPYFVTNYRYHGLGQSADRRVVRNMKREATRLRAEYGAPGGTVGRLYSQLFRLKRQWQKLRHLGTVDLVPGTWALRRHMQPKTTFSSNIDIDKL